MVIDLDSFFASVEQQLDPALRGRPIAVVPVTDTDTTTCIAASKEAKKFGVKTGTRVREARHLCPEIRFVESHPKAYVAMHHEFITAVESCIEVNEIYSIDEVGCRLTGPLQNRPQAEKVAQDIKTAVERRVGEFVTCSVGLAPNHFLAKLGSDMGKPNGIFVLEEQDLPHALDGLKLRDLCGIGPQMEKRLLAQGICDVSQLTRVTKEALHHAWGGIGGHYMYHDLRGEVTEGPPTRKRVLGHSHVLPPQLRHDKGVHSVCHRLLQKAAMRLRKMGYHTKGLQVFVNYDNGTESTGELKFAETQDTLLLLRAFDQIYEKLPRRRFAIPIKTGLSFSPLIPDSQVTPDLFGDAAGHARLCSAVDEMNRKFGQNTVSFGGAMGALEYTPMRIAFTRIPDPETEG